MARLVVYDSMVMLQWAALPSQPQRQHATVTALTTGQVRLAMSQQLLDEISGLFFRPELQRRLPSLTPPHAAAILKKALEFADWFDVVPAVFSLPPHPKDDHLFNLAIASQSSCLVTWETRLLELQDAETPYAKRLREFAPELAILSPRELAEMLKDDSIR